MALRAIRRYQKTVDLLIPKAPFLRLCRELIGDAREGIGLSKVDVRIEKSAAGALQESAEAYLVVLFEYTNLLWLAARHIIKR